MWLFELAVCLIQSQFNATFALVVPVDDFTCFFQCLFQDEDPKKAVLSMVVLIQKNPLANLKCINHTESSKMWHKLSGQWNFSQKLQVERGDLFQQRAGDNTQEITFMIKRWIAFFADVYYDTNGCKTVLFSLGGIFLGKHGIKTQFRIHPTTHASVHTDSSALTQDRYGSHCFYYPCGVFY